MYQIFIPATTILLLGMFLWSPSLHNVENKKLRNHFYDFFTLYVILYTSVFIGFIAFSFVPAEKSYFLKSGAYATASIISLILSFTFRDRLMKIVWWGLQIVIAIWFFILSFI